MNILFLTQILPYPLFGGAKIRAYHMLRHLARNHTVTLVTFTRADDKLQHINHLRQHCKAVHTVNIPRNKLRDGLAIAESLLRNRPISILRDRIPTMLQTLKKLCRSETFDVIHADQTNMAQFALYAQKHSPNSRLLLDNHNAMYRLVKRQARHETNPLTRLVWHREAYLFRNYERTLLQRFDQHLTVTQNDRDALLDLVPAAARGHRSPKITPIPICVERPDGGAGRPTSQATDILHLGTMFWPPNVEGVHWFATRIFPLIRQAMPAATFTVAGKNPPPLITDLATDPQISVPGFVADAQPLYESSRVSIVPLLAGGGMRVKILDSWRENVPVVSTTLGAEGIDYIDGENILIGDTPQQFADHIIRLLSDHTFAQTIAANGRQWVADRYDWRTRYSQVDSVYERLQEVATTHAHG